MPDLTPLNDDGTIAGAFVSQLQSVSAAYDREEADRLASVLVQALEAATPHGADPGLGPVLAALRSLRLFHAVRGVADAFLTAHPDEAVAQRQYAQALIEDKELSGALQVLRYLAASTADSDPAEHAEARGLIGRVYKQLYVDAPSAAPALRHERLRRAVEAYYDAYRESGDLVWHGVNTVALLYRATIDGVPLPGLPDLRDLAQEILETVLAREPLDAWDYATAMEVSVALGDVGAALGYGYQYAFLGDVSAFQLNSTLRQLEQVWDLDRGEGDPEQELVDLLRARLLELKGGTLNLSPAEVEEGAHPLSPADRALDDALSTDVAVTLAAYRRGLTTATAVAQVRVGPTAHATGFLTWSDQVGFSGPRTPVFVTNNHAIASDSTVPNAVHPQIAEVVFHSVVHGGEAFVARVPELLWESPPGELDITIARLDALPPGTEPLTVLPTRVSVQNASPSAPTQRMYAIGYPLKGGFSISIHDNRLLKVDGETFQYRTPTDAGSSGSPVLDQNWHVVGVHRGKGRFPTPTGDGTYVANVGSLLLAVREAIAAENLSVASDAQDAAT